VLHQALVMFQAIYTEIIYEYSHYPVRMLAEAVQFLLLIVIVWVVTMGWGKRKGFVANMLTERAERTSRQIEAASHAAEDLLLAEPAARERLDAAEAEARALVESAQVDAKRIEAAAREEVDAEARRTTERAASALVSEAEEMRAELREELVGIVAQATRSILSEKLSVAEQRISIEAAIVASLGGEVPPPPHQDGVKVKTRPRLAPRSKALS
jgi:F-type H+-transporting ATPase subunit b